MEGTVFLEILKDLRREGWTAEADAFEATMKARADIWSKLAYPYGSEMAWDSTGQEEVYAWTTHFGDAAKARVTLDAILGYMPTLPHWGYNGSARRYWDFLYGGQDAAHRAAAAPLRIGSQRHPRARRVPRCARRRLPAARGLRRCDGRAGEHRPGRVRVGGVPRVSRHAAPRRVLRRLRAELLRPRPQCRHLSDSPSRVRLAGVRRKRGDGARRW